MAKRKRTVAQMLTSLAMEVDLPAFSDSPATFVTQTQAIELLSQSCHAFSQKHQAFGLLAKTGTISVVVGTTAYNLPDDFAALLGMESDPEGVCGSYEFFGDQIVVSEPSSAYTLTIRYVPELPMYNTSDVAIYDFSATTDYILTKGTIDQWVVLDAAIKIYRRQDKDPSAVIAAREEIERDLIQNLIDRDALSGNYVRNDWDIAHDYDIRGPGDE